MCNNRKCALIIDRLEVPSLGRSNFALGRVQSPTQELTLATGSEENRETLSKNMSITA
jgi:hypothetical protein